MAGGQIRRLGSASHSSSPGPRGDQEVNCDRRPPRKAEGVPEIRVTRGLEAVLPGPARGGSVSSLNVEGGSRWIQDTAGTRVELVERTLEVPDQELFDECTNWAAAAALI